MPASDAQADFRGGMVDQSPADRIAENCYAYAENMEIRDLLRTRRGDVPLLASGLFEEGGDLEGRIIGGVGKYVSNSGVESFVLHTYVVSAEGELIFPQTFLWHPPLRNLGDVLLAPGEDGGIPWPSGITMGDASLRVRFTQYYGRLFMLHGWETEANEVWVWDGEAAGWAVAGWPHKTGYAIGAYGRVWSVIKNAADGFIDTVVVSDITFEGALTWPVAEVYSFRVGPGTKDNIIALIEIGGGRIVVLKERSVYVIHNCLTNPEATAYEIEMLDDRHGCVGYGAGCRVGSDVWYLSQDGVRSVSLTLENNVRAISVPASYPVQNFVKDGISLNGGALLSDCVMAIHDNYLICTVPFGGSVNGGPNSALVYDLLGQVWVGVWTDVRAMAMVVVDSAYTFPRLVCFPSAGEPFSLCEVGYHARGSLLITRAFSLGDITLRKRFLAGCVEVSGSGATFIIEARGMGTSSATRCIGPVAVAGLGWSIIIPPEGINIPEEGIWFNSSEAVTKSFYMGTVAKSASLIFHTTGPLAIRSITVSAARSKQIMEA